MADIKSSEFLNDASFLKKIDNQENRFYQVRIEVLNKDEESIESIEGRVLPGSSINIDGSSSMRRTCSINFVAEDADNDLTRVDNLLSINKKIKIYEGIKNNIKDTPYDDIIWFPLGVYVIVQPSISHSTNGCTISLSCKDKMCLLNGECGGNLPTSVTFHAYDQIIGSKKCDGDPSQTVEEPNDQTVYIYNNEYQMQDAEDGQYEVDDDSKVGTRVEVKQLFYDIIQTLVHNFGNEALSKIFINDVPLEIKQLVRYTGNDTLQYNTTTDQYTLDESIVDKTDGTQQEYHHNEDIGYVYTPFTYADLGGGNGELISNIGDNVCTILDKIKNSLGNFEYFYDIKGNFIFQEIKNYLNNQYEVVDTNRVEDKETADVTEQGLCIMDNLNYAVDFYSNTKSVYTFEEGNGLITTFSNSPNYTNLKNDYHIQGKAKDNYAIHFHLVIKDKPLKTVFNGSEYVYPSRKVVFLTNDKGELTGGLRLATETDELSKVEDYTPIDYRAEIYLRGLEKQAAQQRPDVYEQELLDLFDSIYDFAIDNGDGTKGSFKADMVKNPNDLKYYVDYLEPSSELFDCSVEAIGQKIYSYQKDNIKKLYNTEVPNVIIISIDTPIQQRQKIIDRCEREGQPYTNVDDDIYSKIAIGTIGYTAQEVSRDLLYQYTNYAESISIQALPIYYLEPNTRITVYDQKAGIYGDYIIKNISLPLDAGGMMSISATRAYERI